MAEINADPEVMRWIGDGSVRDLEETAEDIERWEEEWDDEGFGLFAVELLGSGELIGFAGLSVPEFLPELAHEVEIGWRLARPFWGRGTPPRPPTRPWSSRSRTAASTGSSPSPTSPTRPPRRSSTSSA